MGLSGVDCTYDVGFSKETKDGMSYVRANDFGGRDVLGLIAGLGATVGLGTLGIAASEYMDFPGFSDDVQAGRTKNSISAVVAGIVGQKLYGNSKIDLAIEKHFWPDAKITGDTTSSSVNTDVDLAFTSARFTGKTDGFGSLKGDVDKSDFDWKVEQTGTDSYEIARFGPKFDATLNLNVEDGRIAGKYVRSGPHFDWDINGRYDDTGNVEIDIKVPSGLDITLKGKITPE